MSKIPAHLPKPSLLSEKGRMRVARFAIYYILSSLSCSFFSSRAGALEWKGTALKATQPSFPTSLFSLSPLLFPFTRHVHISPCLPGHVSTPAAPLRDNQASRRNGTAADAIPPSTGRWGWEWGWRDWILIYSENAGAPGEDARGRFRKDACAPRPLTAALVVGWCYGRYLRYESQAPTLNSIEPNCEAPVWNKRP